MTWTIDLLAGIAQDIAGAGIGTWRAVGSYEPTDLNPVTIGALTQLNVPAIGLTPYGAQDDPGTSDVIQPVQFYLRGDRNLATVDAIGDDLYDEFHGRENVTFNGIRVVKVWRVSAMPMGVDGNGNWLASHNYYFRTNRATTSRPD